MRRADTEVLVSFIENGKEKSRKVSMSSMSHRADDEIASEAIKIVEAWRGTSAHSVLSIERNGLGFVPYTGRVQKKFLVKVCAVVTMPVWERDEDGAKARAENIIFGWQGIEKATANEVVEVQR